MWLRTILVVVLAVAAGGTSRAQQPPAGTPQPEEIRQTNPGFLVRADVDRALRSYRDGDALTLTVACEADAYVYVLYKQADGKVFLIYPNSTQPANRIRARQALHIPGDDDTFRWVVGPPFGREVIKVLAAKEPLEELADPTLREKIFNAVPPQKLKGIELELGTKELAWAEDGVEITTYAADDKQEREGARRLGLFIGLGKYEHEVAKSAMTPDVERMLLAYRPGNRDARLLAGVMQEAGRLNEARILANEEATREKVEEAFTRWLPSRSRPGDTVFVYFSGLAFPLRQGAAGPGEVLLPLSDFVFPGVLETLAEKRQAGKITRTESRLLEFSVQLAQRGGAPAVLRQWAVSDALLAHWLQALAGRQVVILLDAPYAAAFGPAPATPGAAATGGVARLQELGQREIALLGACGTARFDVCRDPQSLSLMTELLVQILRDAPGAMTLQQVHAELARRMDARLNEINQKQQAAGKPAEPPYPPYMVDTCTRPVLLKP